MDALSLLPVLRVRMIGTVTSFRYPHFAQGFQPTFEMPPPATLYGHICSAVGEYIPPASTRFALHFTHTGKFIDFQEHLHFKDPVQPFPFNRELLYNPALTLYLTDIGLESAFRSPRYPVVLGRSQDLMTYVSVDVVTLERHERAYFEHTLLPLDMAPRLREPTIAVTMPRWIDPRRRPSWGQYALLQRRSLWPQERLPADDWDEDLSDDGLDFEQPFPVTLWVDPDSPRDTRLGGIQRAIWFHRFVDED
jgi:CRISPR-associated protein Cas5t